MIINGVSFLPEDITELTNVAYHLCTNNTSLKAKTDLYAFHLCLTYDDNYILPINAVNNDQSTTKPLTTESFNPFGSIYYYNNTEPTFEDSIILAKSLYLSASLDLTYSFNSGWDLIPNQALYLVAVMQPDGRAILHSTPLSQSLPTTEDGLIYIYLGNVFINDGVYLEINHPIYQYKNGAIQLYTQDAATVNGHTVAADVPSDAVFTDTVYTHPTVTRTDTTSSDTLDYQEDFTVIDSVISTDDHVTAVNTKTLTMPKSYIYPVEGTQSAATSAWTGTIDLEKLYDGLTIAYYLPYAGSSGTNATLTLTLSNNTTTNEVPVYAYGTTRAQTHFGAGSTIILTYWNNANISERWSHGDYYSTLAVTMRNQYGSYIAATNLYRYMLCFTKHDNKLLPPNTSSNTTGTSKTITSSDFDPFGQIYYYLSTTTVSANGTISNVLHTQYLADLRYSFNTGKTLTAGTAVYVVANPTPNGMATFASTPIAQTLPTTEDGKIYIYLGQAYDTYRVELVPKHPVYQYKNGALQTISSADIKQNVEIEMFKNIFKRLETDKSSTLTWESGSVNQTSGANFNSSTRIRTANFLPCKDYTHITVASGYKYAIYLFSSANASDLIGSWDGITNVSTAQWSTREQWIGFDNSYYMKIIMAKDNDSAVDTTIASNLIIYGLA